jgi:hypothetical protein
MSIGLRDADCFQASMLAISDRLIALFMATSARPRKYSSENVFQGTSPAALPLRSAPGRWHDLYLQVE